MSKLTPIWYTNVPGYMGGIQPAIIYSIFSRYNYDSTIGVEVGSLHGRSSVIIATAIKKGKLVCIDPWSGNYTHNPLYSDKAIEIQGYPKKGTINTIEFFMENTKKCTNISTIQGYSPQVVAGWSEPIDFLFLDADHSNPGDRENIDFWLPKIKNNGCIVGHDYSKNFPDVIQNVKFLEEKLNQKVQTFTGTSLWKFDIKK